MKSPEYSMIEELLKNPLLVSLLFAAYDYKQTNSFKKTHFFTVKYMMLILIAMIYQKGDGFIHEKKVKFGY